MDQRDMYVWWNKYKFYLKKFKQSIKMDNTVNMFITMQHHMSNDILKQIFPEDCAHYNKKWIDSSNNFLIFISKLDDINRHKVLKWGMSIVEIRN